MSNKTVKVLLAILFFSTLIATIPASADEIDNVLSKCEIAPDPIPSVMVSGYEVKPETLMPGDIGIVTITLRNTQEEPIEKEINIEEEEYHGKTTDIDTETRFTMDAYIREAHLVEGDFKVYNRHIGAGVVGPDQSVDLAFKIKAPAAQGIYMLKFVADIENMHGRSSKGIHYYIPVTVSGSLEISPVEISLESTKLELVNEGLSTIDDVVVSVSNASGIEYQVEKVYIGKMKPNESTIVNFPIVKAEEGNSAVFKVAYRNGINPHESSVRVEIPCDDVNSKPIQHFLDSLHLILNKIGAKLFILG